MIVVSDTSPIRGLIAIKKIILLNQLFKKVIIPSAVEQELLLIKLLASDIHYFLNQPWVEIRKVSHSADYNIIRKHLDRGESEAIILAKELRADLLLMDENKGRQLALGMSLKVIGLIGVLIHAKRTGLIPELRSLLYELVYIHGFWIDKQFYDSILRSVNEK